MKKFLTMLRSSGFKKLWMKAQAMAKPQGLRLVSHSLVAFLLIPLAMRVLPAYMELYRKAIKFKRMCSVGREIRHWEGRRKEILSANKNGYRCKAEDLEIDMRNLEPFPDKAGPVTVAQIDQDGYLLSKIGPLKDAPVIEKEEFLVICRN